MLFESVFPYGPVFWEIPVMGCTTLAPAEDGDLADSARLNETQSFQPTTTPSGFHCLELTRTGPHLAGDRLPQTSTFLLTMGVFVAGLTKASLSPLFQSRPSHSIELHENGLK